MVWNRADHTRSTQTHPQPLGRVAQRDRHRCAVSLGRDGAAQGERGLAVYEEDYTKGYPYRFGRVTMAARLYLLSGSLVDRQLLIRLVNEAMDPDFFEP